MRDPLKVTRQGPQGLYHPDYEHDACGVGFVAHIKGKKSHEMITRGLDVLVNMDHRGAAGADPKTGDGAGILIQMPHRFFATLFKDLPSLGDYASGLIFLPRDSAEAATCVSIIEHVIREEGQDLLAWREVPVDSSVIGVEARRVEPTIKQILIGKHGSLSRVAFERKLYVIRKVIENRVRDAGLSQAACFYIPSLSTYTFIYKGLLLPDQVGAYFLDLKSPLIESAVALVHSRFSTNTFPTWDLAQPFRMLAHNGEINTIRGNILKMQAREGNFVSPLFEDEEIEKMMPVIRPAGSDSASLDNALEFLVASGRTLPNAMMMLIPEAWNEKNPLPQDRRDLYEYYSTLMEPWDGPATVAFCDGRVVGATLDRNGLRPARYVLTQDDLIVFASEVGVQTFASERIQYKGRLYPGKMLLIDLEEGRMISDDELKDEVAKRRPYGDWLEKNRLVLDDLEAPARATIPVFPEHRLHEFQRMFGYTLEDVQTILAPMAENGEEPVGSMGTDTPLAVLSDKPQRLFNYFKQLFAQVTNPPIDPIREELVMSLTSYVGPQGNLLDETPNACRVIKYKQPVLTHAEIETLLSNPTIPFKSVRLPILFPASDDRNALQVALDALCDQAVKQVEGGVTFLILSDKGADRENVAIPSLLAAAGVHHHLIRKRLRARASLIIETAEAREVMHLALLMGYGADIVNPYLAFATIADLSKKGVIAQDEKNAEKRYVKALNKGLLKVMSKMGISTLRSYRGSQLFEAVGLSDSVVDTYFTGTPSRIGGLSLADIAREAKMAHAAAFVVRERADTLLPSEGIYRYRVDGERHAWNPETISLLQEATRSDNPLKFREFSDKMDAYTRENGFLRGFFDFEMRTPVSLDDVEPVSAIVKRFATGAMSYGSISKEAHESLAIAMNQLGGKSNTGEGGEDSERFVRRADGTSARSAIKQIASARFGVSNHYLRNADEIQIKIAQGAKPGEGGQLPGHKIDAVIARLRHSTPGVTLISPPPHHDIYSIEDLKQLIFDLKHVNPKAYISVKLVAEAGVGTVAAGVAKANADTITVSGFEGGTGASPVSSVKHAGLPWELGIAETQQTLVLNNLRGRVKLHTDGQLKTARDVVVAAMLGAEEFGFSTAPLIALGCIMMRKCHLNTCPVGVATQDPELRKRFSGQPEHVVHYFASLAAEIRELMASLGVRRFDELIGRTDWLKPRLTDGTPLAWKRKHLDFSKVLYRPDVPDTTPVRYMEKAPHPSEGGLDKTVLEETLGFFAAKPDVQKKGLDLALTIINTDRSVGAMLSGEISDRFGEQGLPDHTIRAVFNGTAGQSFGAFLASGVSFKLEGDANDYLGKGLSGGKIIVVPEKGSHFVPERNVIVGNTLLYGAIKGEVFIRGRAGERFCVRNSGAVAVVEGVGDHGCEYMTGGCVVVLGKTGRNFAAGMSGGIAYVLDKDGGFPYFCNPDMVELAPVSDPEDEAALKALVRAHYLYTGSSVAKDLLDDWESMISAFVKLTPTEYKHTLEKQGKKPVFSYEVNETMALREVVGG